MSLNDDLRKKLTPELYETVVDALGDDFNFDVVPRSRLNKVIKQKQALQEALENTTAHQQQEEFDDFNDGDDHRGNRKKKLPEQQQPKQVSDEEIQQKIAAEVAKVKIQYAGLEELRKAGVVDPEFAYSALDLSKVKYENDTVTGFAEQIEALKASKAYLFPKEESQSKRDKTPGGTGRSGTSGEFNGVNTIEEFMKLSTADQAKFKETYPDQFNKFIEM